MKNYTNIFQDRGFAKIILGISLFFSAFVFSGYSDSYQSKLAQTPNTELRGNVLVAKGKYISFAKALQSLHYSFIVRSGYSVIIRNLSLHHTALVQISIFQLDKETFLFPNAIHPLIFDTIYPITDYPHSLPLIA